MRRFLQYGVPLAAWMALSACNFAPEYVPPVVATPPAFKESGDWTLATPRDSAPRGAWWRVFHDPMLDDLEEQVGAANQDLKVAVARFDEARRREDRAGRLLSHTRCGWIRCTHGPVA